jgi:hypothetical protein
MGGAHTESRLFHTIVVVGLSLASTECGSATRTTEDDAGGDSSTAPAASSTSDASTRDGPGLTIGLGDAAAMTSTSDGGPCPPDAAPSDASSCVWPVYI